MTANKKLSNRCRLLTPPPPIKNPRKYTDLSASRVYPPPDNIEMLLHISLVRCKPSYFHQATLSLFQLTPFHVDHTQIVPRLDVIRLQLQDFLEAGFGSVQVAVMVDINVAHQNETLAVIWMMLSSQTIQSINIIFIHRGIRYQQHCND